MQARSKWITIVVIIVILFLIVMFMKDNTKTMPSDMMKDAKQSSVTSASTSIEDWKKFTSEDNQFSVMLPTIPQHASEAVPLPNGQGSIKYDMYLSQEKDGSTFMISMIHYPENFDTSNPDILLEGVMKEMLSGSEENALKSSEKKEFKTLPSLNFAINNKDFVIHGLTFLSGKTLYVLTMIDRNMAGSDNQFGQFVDSFEVTQK